MSKIDIGKIADFNELDKDIQDLIRIAVKALEFSYSPYSKFKVGAAIRCVDNKIFSGCNIESVSFTPSICAERTAISKAVSEGNKNFNAIAIIANSESDQFTPPCGVCRQVMKEFCRDLKIYLTRTDMNKVLVTTLTEIFPLSFSLQTEDVTNSNK